MRPELRALEGELRALRAHPLLAPLVDESGKVRFDELTLEQVRDLLAVPTAALFLMAAADVSRTDVKAGTGQPDAQLVPAHLRRAFAVRSKLPPAADVSTIVEVALRRRAPTLDRNVNAATEVLFRERLAFEGIPIRMRGAYTPSLLIDRRKPDGVFPDPDTGRAPELYLEIKKVNRVSDDIQKRLYEIAEVSIEVKYLYGGLVLEGREREHLLDDAGREEARRELREQILAASPAVVALVLCRFEELNLARRYRDRAEAFVDRMFLADEIDDCIAFLAEFAPPGDVGG